MNIKKLIGQRIQSARKAKGLTQTELAKLAGDLKQPRINNWERGIRTPGLLEIKQIANALDVSPAYLMCLTARQQLHPMDQDNIGALIPLLNYEQASNAKLLIQNIKENEYENKVSFIPINYELAKMAGEFAFAFTMNDESMESELRKHDVLIVCPELNPKPGNFVIAKIDSNSEIIIRRYKLLSISKVAHEFELLANNKHWPDIQNNASSSCTLLGTVIYLHRLLVAI